MSAWPDAILSFVETTGADPDVAQRYLEVSDGDVQTAVQLYFENGGTDLLPASNAQTTGGVGISFQDLPTGSASFGALDGYEFDHGLDDNARTSAIDHENDISVVGERFNDAQNAHRSPNAYGDVRAPIASRREALVSDYDMNANFNIGSNGSSFMQTRPFVEHHNPFNQSVNEILTTGTDPLDNGGISGIPSLSSDIESKEGKLAALFRPPVDIIFRGTFENAKSHSRSMKRWLFIDLQDTSEFQCQMLNRDLWSNQPVKDFVRSNFVFLQYKVTESEGQRYKTFYPVVKYPHLAIIDPRTGERVKVLDYNPLPAEFLDICNTFLSTNSLLSTAAVQPLVKGEVPKKAIAEMSEEEQIEAAIHASMEAMKGSVKESTPSETINTSVSDVKGKEKQTTNHTSKDPQNAIEQIQAKDSPEPPQGPDTTRIQLILPDGSRVVRRFRKADCVRVIFEYAKAKVPDTQKMPFELVFHRSNLAEKLEQSLDEAGLANVSLQMSYL